MKIFIATNPTDAHLLCELLKQAGIVCDVRGEGLFGLRGELPLNDDTAPYIWLFHPEQREQALALIEEYIRPASDSTTKSWRCHYCGEINEAQFALCWQCGKADQE